MPRHKGRTSAKAIEKDFPHIVQMIEQTQYDVALKPEWISCGASKRTRRIIICSAQRDIKFPS
jgi:hypothetical protein